jgi:integrase
LKRRRQGWYFRLAVPRDLREAYGSDIISVSLKTRDLTEAQQRRWPKLIEYQEAFRRLGGAPSPAPDDELGSATLAMIDEIALATYRDKLAKLDADARQGKGVREHPEGADPIEQEITGLAIYSENLGEALEYDDFRAVAGTLANQGPEFAAGSRAYRELGRALLRAYIAAVDGRAAALSGHTSEHPQTFMTSSYVDPVSLAPVRSGGGLAFSKAAARFIAEVQRDKDAALTEQTKGQHEAVFRLFEGFVRDAPLKSIDRATASDFLDKVARLHPDWGRSPETKKLSFSEVMQRHADKGKGLSNKTLNRYVSSLTSLFKWARKRGYVEETAPNPFSEQSRPKARKGTFEWVPYTVAELNKIFDAPVFHARNVTPAEHTVETALQWVPLIGLFSGMRLNEICQLNTADVHHEGKFWYFNVTEEAEGVRLKTEAAVRRVPLHAEILNCGFAAYCEALPPGPLFPGLKPGGPDKKLSWYFTRRYTEFRRRLGITRPRVSFHSFRKNVVTVLDNARVPEPDAAAIIGHERGFTFDTYSAGLDLPALQSIVDKIDFKGLDIRHLYAL